MQTKWNRIATYIIFAVICVIISYFYFLSYHEVRKIYEIGTYNTVVNIKKSFLKNTVDNLIFELEADRATEMARYQGITDRRYEKLILEPYASEKEFQDYFINRFELDANQLNFWTVLLWDEKSGAVIYDPKGLFNNNISTTVKELESSLSYYRIIEYGNLTGVFGVQKEYIDHAVKESIAVKIKNMEFDNNSYIWINEVLDYKGGEDYAIRLVHPNLPDTEGMYLSTDMTDLKGNFPYLAELEGVKKDGEIFLKYYFKELNSDKVSEKITYAKLYKEYNWIIAMGVHTNDIQMNIDATNKESNELAYKRIVQLVFWVLIIVSFCLILFVAIEKFSAKRIQKKLELQISTDLLTNACSRRSGTNDLVNELREFKRGNSDPAIMMFDVDNFKSINDRYGHDVGDQILKEIVEKMYKITRNSDKLICWGGDEFIGIFYELNRENAISFGEKILAAVSSIKIFAEGETVTPTLSMGITYFTADDIDITDTLKRVDRLMYKSKNEGKNKVNVM